MLIEDEQKSKDDMVVVSCLFSNSFNNINKTLKYLLN